MEAHSLNQLEPWEGLIPKLSNDEYHKLPELSSSDVKTMIISPYHFDRNVNGKSEIVRLESEAFAIGDFGHSVFLEQRVDGFVKSPGFDRRTKIGKADAEAFALANAGKRILLPDQYDRVLKMFDVIAGCRNASDLVSTALIEQSYRYLDVETGLRCKFRPDAFSLTGLDHSSESLGLSAGQPYLCDYKTAQSASPHEFSKASARYHYNLSMAHYLAGIERVFGARVREVRLVVQEKQEPFALAIYRMSESDIERSLQMRATLLRRIKECRDANHYPMWSQNVISLNVPGYAFDLKEQQ